MFFVNCDKYFLPLAITKDGHLLHVQCRGTSWDRPFLTAVWSVSLFPLELHVKEQEEHEQEQHTECIVESHIFCDRLIVCAV
jgi:hypothetical protein